MTTEEEIKVVIQSLQDQIKYGQEMNNEVRKRIIKSIHNTNNLFSFDMILIINRNNKKHFQMIMTT